MTRDIAAREAVYAQAQMTIDCAAVSDDEALERILAACVRTGRRTRNGTE